MSKEILYGAQRYDPRVYREREDGSEYRIVVYDEDDSENTDVALLDERIVFQATPCGVGLTNEALLTILLDRLEILNDVLPCAYNGKAIWTVKAALSALQDRTADRRARCVEGTMEP